MSSKIETLYTDAEKTNALYPRTKVSAISDDSGKPLKQLLQEAVLPTINLLRPTLQTQTVNGVTITNNGDGTYTLNGTASASDEITIFDGNFKCKNAKMVGCPSGGSDSTYRMFVYWDNSLANNMKDYGDGSNAFTIENKNLKLKINIYSGVTYNNLVFKPMITADLDATYDDFVSYNNSLATNQNIINATRINYLRPTLGTTTSNGVTCTNNGDGTYTLNGTVIERKMLFIGEVNLNLNKNYKLVGCPNNTINICVINDDYSYYAFDTGEGVVFDTLSYSHYRIRLDLLSGKTFNNLVIKPMITDDLSATYDDFVSGFDCLTPDLKMDLLWTNASVGSAFGIQTVSLDLSNYKFVYIVIYRKKDNSTFHGSKLIKIGDSAQILTSISGSSCREIYSVGTDGIYFGSGVYNGSDNNDYGIPYQIYGVR